LVPDQVWIGTLGKAYDVERTAKTAFEELRRALL
jgi:hypothetical protein